MTITVFGGGAIVSMQNGLNEELIAAAVGERGTVGCLVNWAADWTAPGRIPHGGEGALVLGELDGRRSARVDALAKLLEVVAPTRVSDNILGEPRRPESGWSRSTSTTPLTTARRRAATSRRASAR